MNDLKKNRFAIVMTAQGMSVGANAFINGLDYYGNKVDFYLAGGPQEEALVKKAKEVPDLSVNLIFLSMTDLVKKWQPPKEKRGGWHVRFFRYRIAREYCQDYDAVLIIDADMLCVNNLMNYFEIAYGTGKIVLPTNTWGMPLEKTLQVGIESLRGASSPPFHNMPLFLNVKKHSDFLDKVWEWGLKEDYGDMVTVSRTLIRENWLDRVFSLYNLRWVCSSWYHDYIKKVNWGDKHYLILGEEKMFTVHRRWWMSKVVEKFVNDIKEVDNLKRGRNNAKLFWDEYKFFNTQWKVKLDWTEKEPQMKKEI